ncbi:hypothetical protein FBULB1_3039 [Fusarium bulbicola]|nr:hypothetical protein FBULB1_3039 [Fusarium bulbicola]
MPKVEKIEEHFAYARAATSLHRVRQHLNSQLESLFFKCLAIRRTVRSCDKHIMCLLKMRKLARYFSAYRYTQSLSPEGSNIFTIQEMATCTDKKMNYNGPKDLKIQGLEILYPESTSRSTRLCFIENGLVNTGFDYDPMAIDAVDGNPWSGHLVWPPCLNYIELLGKKMEGKGKGKDLEALFSILTGKTTQLRLHRRRKMPWDRR